MKIIDRRNNETKLFEELKEGDAFIYCGFLYLKTDKRENVNAVLLFNGSCSYIDNKDVCFPVECEIVVKR